MPTLKLVIRLSSASPNTKYPNLPLLNNPEYNPSWRDESEVDVIDSCDVGIIKVPYGFSLMTRNRCLIGSMETINVDSM